MTDSKDDKYELPEKDKVSHHEAAQEYLDDAAESWNARNLSECDFWTKMAGVEASLAISKELADLNEHIKRNGIDVNNHH